MLLFVGRFVEKKGLGILKQLVGNFKDVDWIFAGWGPFDPALWGYPHVRVLTGLRSEALVPFYRAADLLVLPSVGEGLPLVVQEAMSCGTPVLVGDETAEAVAAGPDLLFSCAVKSPNVVELWSQALRRILADRSALQAMRDEVATFARAHWSWELCGADYSRMLKTMSSGPAASRDSAQS